MNKKIFILSVVLLLSSCGIKEPHQSDNRINNIPDTKQSTQPQNSSPESLDQENQLPAIFIPDRKLTVEETVAAYFEQQYLSYVNLSYIDISSILDIERQPNKSLLVWLKTLTLRRKLIYDNGFCYVETRRFPYTITYDDNPADQRMENWRGFGALNNNDTIVHFRITGIEEQAYPPFMAMNTQHSIFMREVDGMWKITRHYYPGSSRLRAELSEVAEQQDMLEELKQEFAPISSLPDGAVTSEQSIPNGAVYYNASLAAEYAMRYTTKPNPSFYNAGDWLGNCANFISQCLWYGFGSGKSDAPSNRENMTNQWYGGVGGGSSAWENVNNFWENITESRSLKGTVISSASALLSGDIVQSRLIVKDENNFNHMFLVVDGETLMMAQNTPGCYIYYSDLAYMETRYVRPLYLVN